MILTILFFILGILGIVLLVISGRTYSAFCTILAVLFIFIGFVAGILGTIWGINSIINQDILRETAIEQREVIVYRLEQQAKDCENNNFTVNGGVYEDMLDFNKKIRIQNKWGTNPWFNWFAGWSYAGLEEIEVVGRK